MLLALDQHERPSVNATTDGNDVLAAHRPAASTMYWRPAVNDVLAAVN
jgi:hypothetical protein